LSIVIQYSDMSWLQLESGRDLKLATTVLLEDPRTLFKKSKPESSRPIWWNSESFKRDALVFSHLTEVCWASQDLSDEAFVDYILPHLEVFMSKSEIWTRLKSSDIKVTKGHKNLRPYDHIINVLKSLNTKDLTSLQRLIVRLAAIGHDLGKAISAGIPREEVDVLMNEYFNKSHSFPNHDLLSVLILESLATHPLLQKKIQKIGEKTWQQMLLIVHNHHIFEFKIKPEEGIDEFADLQTQMPDISKDEDSLEALLLTFVLAFADTNSTPEYQKYWPDKLKKLEQLLEPIEQSLPLRSFIFAGLNPININMSLLTVSELL
jgi:CRISPR/Cas system-associated endonuclease Cas3-HD